MVKGSRPVIDGTLQGPDALIELVAFHLHRLGAARANVVTFVADGTPWIWARLDWVIAQVKLAPFRVVEVLDWCHGVHHLSLALAALDLVEERRGELYSRLRRLLKAGKSRDVIAELEVLSAGQPEDSAVWREFGYLTRHSEAGRLRYKCFRCRGVPLGSGAIESTIRRVINLRLKGTSIYWTKRMRKRCSSSGPQWFRVGGKRSWTTRARRWRETGEPTGVGRPWSAWPT